MTVLKLDPPNEKQRQMLTARTKHIGFGGARGGGKSWAVRTKAKLLALRYPGIKILIVRRSYPELVNNHITILRAELQGIAKYNDKDKVLRFQGTGESSIHFMYCARDADLDRLQGVEYDVIFLDEATQLSEFQMKSITACLRGANSFPKRVYYTCNPGGQGHAYIKRIFLDRRYEPGEDPADYTFIRSLVTDNRVLMEAQPDYIKQLRALPEKLRKAWLEGDWDIFEGQFFEDLRLQPDPAKCAAAGLSPEEAKAQGRWTHVIPARAPAPGWKLYRSFDWGYSRPYSCAWWAVDFDGRLYRILELYGCTENPNEGVRQTPDEVFRRIRELEDSHPWLRGRHIEGVADPAIWDESGGESIAETGECWRVYFSPGDHKRIPGWMQCHERLRFDAEGLPMMYVYDTCKAFLRTVPGLIYDPLRPEDLDSDGEDHAADEWRYMCMARPITPKTENSEAPKALRWGNPLGK